VSWQLSNEGYLMSDGTEFANGSSSVTAGQLLKAAREAQGLHIAALAVSLKVPVKKLELLEADRLDELPDAVFIRALASSMCRALKVDATEILAKLPQTNKPRLNHAEQSLNAPFRMPTDGPAPSMLTSLSRPAVLGVMALLLAALVLIFLPDMQQKSGDAANAALSGLKSSVASVSLGGESSGTAMGAGSVLTNDGSERPATAGVGDAQTTVALSANGVQSVNPTASTPTVASPTLIISTSLSTDAAVAADGIVVFRAKGETWVEVIDVNNKVTLRKLLAPGEAAGASGAVPLRVTVGRADQTSVIVRGKPFDGESLVRDNVLRFEVR
jgi:cytoskeleton protein RodZ